ncbi:uncharacterized protein LOC110987342 [Acanthaster planci]|uniref:Uncharacterized protein LOC110987342 n=1 Tax=Acanthaster planci TaxID=133434 RepID=A0A8B7ZJI6_ACAPL|nr:uncharacterized protein LOC110987342 [Acanthaster planci]
MNATNGSTVTWPFIEKLEVSRWAEFTLWLTTFCLGVPGNVMILGVCSSRRIRTTTYVLVAALATADVMICLLKLADAINIASVSQYLEYDAESVVYFLSTGFLYTTALLIMAIAVDRFDAVCRSRHRVMTLRRAKVTAGACFIAGFVGIIPEAVNKIQEGLELHHADIDIFTRAFFKLLPITLYITSLITVTILYSAVFVFIRKHQVIVEPEPNSSTQQIATGTSFKQGQHSVVTSLAYTSEVSQSNSARPSCSEESKSDICNAWAYPSQQSFVGRRSKAPLNTKKQLRIIGTRVSLQNPTESIKEDVGPHHPSAQPSLGRPRRPSLAQSRITKMLFITTFFLFVLWLPNLCIKIYALQGNLYVDFLKSSHYANAIAALIVLRDIMYLNSVVNVFVYGMCNKRFRKDCKEVIRKLRQRINLARF